MTAAVAVPVVGTTRGAVRPLPLVVVVAVVAVVAVVVVVVVVVGAGATSWRGLVVNSISWRTRTFVQSPRPWCTLCHRCRSAALYAFWSFAPDSSWFRSRPRTWPSLVASSTGSCFPCRTPARPLCGTSDLRTNGM